MRKGVVLTGDIINSRKIQDKELLISSLEKIFNELQGQYSFSIPFEIYRGDSFQALINHRYGLRIAILIRLGLRKLSPSNHLWDARIGLGIGNVEYITDNIKISNGEAFELSGEALKSNKKNSRRICIKTSDTTRNRELDTLNALADALSNRWSKNVAEVAYSYLLYNTTQKEIAEKLQISQSAVQQRLANADFDAIYTYIRYFENLNL